MRTHFSGVVEKGKRRGSALGYPTINIALADSITGIFAAEVTVDGSVRPAAVFADPERKVLEAYILDFFGDLYGKEVTVELKKKIRDRETFHSDEALKTAIAEDVRAVRQYFSL
jgi:riboflavin kinase/FMN adenylyltransferase